MNLKDQRLEVNFSPNVYALLLVSPMPRLGRFNRLAITSLSPDCRLPPTSHDLPPFSDQTQGVFEDKLNWEHFLDVHKGYFREPTIELCRHHVTTSFKTKAHVLDRLKAFFSIAKAEGLMLILTGDSAEGSLVLDLPDHTSEVLTCEELMDLWKGNKRTGEQYLLLVLDFDNSGAWVNKIAGGKPNNIFVQASCDENQVSLDMPGRGSVFLNNFLFANGFPVEFSQAFRKEGVVVQTPRCYGARDTAKRIFDLNTALDTWEKMVEIQKVKRGNLKYEGAYTLKEGGGHKWYLPHGLGKIKMANGAVKYEGSFSLGKRHGLGVYLFNNGDKYRGNFAEDEISGHGTLEFKDKLRGVYNGQFKNGVFEGEGTLQMPDGRIIKGTWMDGELNG